MDMTLYVACYRQWITTQEEGLRELAAAARNAAAGRATDAELRAVVERCMRGYEDYATSRRDMARGDSAAFFAPPWCTAFENSLLWLGGCRPSLAIRLLYSLSGEGLEAHIDGLVSGLGDGMAGVMGLIGITARQLGHINDLHRRTLRDEGALTDRLATLQEDIADHPLLPIVRERERDRASAGSHRGIVNHYDGLIGRLVVAGSGGPVDAELDAAMESYKAGLTKLLEKADELRLSTVRTLATEILTPRQAIETLLAAKQLHLSVREWSQRREGAQLPRTATAAASSDKPNP